MQQIHMFPVAIDSYKKALESQPSANDRSFDLTMQSAYNLALIYQRSGNTSEAKRIMEKYIVI